jgi:hypothetical protein
MMAPVGGGPIGQVGFGSGSGAIGGDAAVLAAAGPIFPGTVFGRGSESILSPGAFTEGQPVGPASLFNIGGAPIAILGGVFTNGLPLGGPVGQVFRSSAPEPNTLFISTLTPSGPIGTFLIGSAGSLIFGPDALFLALPESIGQQTAFILQTSLERPSELATF